MLDPTRFYPFLLLAAMAVCHVSAADKLLLDFEKQRDVNMWEVKAGNALALSAQPVISGQHAMQVTLDSHITSSMLPRDWSGYQFLEISYHNTLPTPVSVMCVIADMSWLDKKGYWNQYNNFFLLDSGPGKLQIPITQLFRGQKDRKNLDIKTNINPAEIVRVELEFKGQEGVVYLDDFKLTGAGGTALAAAAPAPAVVPAPAPAVVPAPAVTAPAPAEPGTQMWTSFEHARDLGMWEVRTGPQPSFANEHVIEGAQSLKVYPGNLLATHNITRDWTGFESLELYFYNACERAIKMELLIGDDAWIGSQNYWNRHNRTVMLAPGANYIAVPTRDLYRGEGSARNRGDIQRNIDLHQINFISFTFTGKAAYGDIFLDNFYFVKKPQSVVAPAPAPLAAAPVAAAPVAQPAAVVAPVAPVAVAPAAVAQPGTHIWADFERPSALGYWEIREGLPPKMQEQYATSGKKSMELRGGYVLATYNMPKDWSGYDTFAFDVYNPGETLRQIDLMIGDEAFTQQQDYWNRYNSVVNLVPGANTIEIPVSGMYRGEAGARNRAIQRNIDANQIVIFTVSIRGKYKDGPLFFDSFRLVKGDVVPGVPGVSLNAAPAVVPAPAAAPVPVAPAPVAPAPVVAAPVAPVAAAPAAVVQPGTHIWADFERPSALGYWEVREGLPPKMQEQYPTSGKKSMELRGGYVLATYNMPKDWSGYDTFAFDVYNPGETLRQIDLMIGDEAFTQQQDYWNRYNSVVNLVPGANTIEIPVTGMYRGEAGARNRVIKRNIDANQIVIFTVSIRGKYRDGPLFFDSFRLVKGDVVPGVPGVSLNTAPAAVPAAAPVAAPPPAPVQVAAPAAVTPVAPAAPVARAAAQAGDLVWESFETLADIGKWEVRTGVPVKLDTNHATHGAHALRVLGGNLLATYAMPRDWTGYEALEFDIFYTGQALHKLEVLIGDDAWISQQDYWNRHNAIYMIVPGENTISIPVNGLYRGEAGARNRSIKRNIDINQIHFMSLSFQGRGRDGKLYLDNMRLTTGDGGGGVGLNPGSGASLNPAPPPAAVPVSTPAARPAVAAPAPVAVDRGKVVLLEGFEDFVAFSNRWEVRTGDAPAVVAEHATEGDKSLKVAPGNFLASANLPRDWSGFEAFEFDVFNPAETLVKLEFVVGDAAWNGARDYWNRHNAIYMITPGANTISVPVAGLYRGEAGARNRNIPRNIDVDKVEFVSFWFHGNPKQGALFVDNCRLVEGNGGVPVAAVAAPATGGGAPVATAPVQMAISSAPPPPGKSQVWGFDFGPKDQALWPGFQGITWDTTYRKDLGYGLEKSQQRSRYAGDTTWPSRMLQDFLWIPYGEFFVDVPNDTYDVWVFFEDSGYWAEEHSPHVKRYIYAEGKEVDVVDRTAQGPDGDSRYLFEHFEPEPGMDVLRYFWDKLYQPRSFSVTVSDGRLNLGVYSEGELSGRVAAIVFHRAGDEQAIAWKQNLMEKNFREMRSKAAMHPFPKTIGLDKLPPEELTKPAIAFLPDMKQNLILTGGPTPEQLGRNLSGIGTPGETVSATFALRPNKSLGEVQASCAGLSGSRGKIPGSDVEVLAVRHIGKRPFGDRSFKVQPWYLSNADQVALKEGITRQFWVNVSIPPGTAAGKYKGVVVVTAGAHSERFPLEVTVLPFTLERPDIPICFFDMPADSLEFFAKYGVTAVNGGPRIKFMNWNRKTMKPNMDYSEVDAYLAKAKALGMDLEVMDYNGPITVDGMTYHNAFGFFREKGKWQKIEPLDAGKRIFDAIQQHAKEAKWPPFTYNMVDEPLSTDNTKACLGNIRVLRNVAPWMKLVGYFNFNLRSDRLGNDELFKALDGTICKTYSQNVLDYAKEHDKSIYLYSLGRTRYTFGPYLFRHRLNGIKGYVQWHSYIVHGYQYFDLDGREPDDGVIVYRTEGIRPTLDLERIRTGIYDYRYLLTLEKSIAKARNSGKGKAQVDAAEAYLDDLMTKITKDSRGKPGWLNLDDMRRDLTRHILLLKKYASI